MENDAWPIILYLKNWGLIENEQLLGAILRNRGGREWRCHSGSSKEMLILYIHEGISPSFYQLRLYPSISRSHDYYFIFKPFRGMSIEIREKDQSFKEIATLMSLVIDGKIWDHVEIRKETEERIKRVPHLILQIPNPWLELIEIALEREPILAVKIPDKLPSELIQKYGHIQEMADAGIL